MAEPSPWRVERLISTLRLSNEPPELLEVWSIVATASLASLHIHPVDPCQCVAPSSVPDAAASVGGISMQVLYGARLAPKPGGDGRPLEWADRSVPVQVWLPHPACAGERVRFGTLTRLPRNATQHVLVSPADCELLQLRAQFNLGERPRVLRPVDQGSSTSGGRDGAPGGRWPGYASAESPSVPTATAAPASAVGSSPGGRSSPVAGGLTVDDLGEVFVEFHGTQRGECYGFSWEQVSGRQAG